MANAKGYCEDLSEGKFSFPVIHSLRNSATENNDLLNILRLRTEDVKLKSHAVWYMRKQTKSFDYSDGVLRRLGQQARMIMEGLDCNGKGNNDMMAKLLVKLVTD